MALSFVVHLFIHLKKWWEKSEKWYEEVGYVSICSSIKKKKKPSNTSDFQRKKGKEIKENKKTKKKIAILFYNHL